MQQSVTCVTKHPINLFCLLSLRHLFHLYHNKGLVAPPSDRYNIMTFFSESESFHIIIIQCRNITPNWLLLYAITTKPNTI